MIGQKVLAYGSQLATVVEEDTDDAYVWVDLGGSLIRFRKSSLSVIA